MCSHFFPPVILTVTKEPLVATCDDTFVVRTRDDLFFRLVVWNGKAIIQKHFLNFGFGFFNFLALGDTDEHLAFVETLLVGLFLSSGEEILVLLTLDFEFINKLDGTHVAIIRNGDDWDWLERYAPFLLNAIFFSNHFLGLQISQSSPIIGRVRWHGGNNTSSLLHTDCLHWQSVNLIIARKRSG